MSLWGEIRDRVNGETVRKEEVLYEEQNLWSFAEGIGGVATGTDAHAEGIGGVATIQLSDKLSDLRKEFNKYTLDKMKYKKELCGKYRKFGGL